MKACRRLLKLLQKKMARENNSDHDRKEANVRHGFNVVRRGAISDVWVDG